MSTEKIYYIHYITLTIDVMWVGAIWGADYYGFEVGAFGAFDLILLWRIQL